MFANRYTVFVDACVLAGALKRNILLSLAAAEFFRIRWSSAVLDETQQAIEAILNTKGLPDAAGRSLRARAAMEAAFQEAMVSGFDEFLKSCGGIPDPKDIHVLAAAMKAQSATIVTDNLRDFPASILEPLNIEARSADDFIADTIELDEGRAVAAIRKMRLRLKRPEKSPELLLLDMEAVGLAETVNVLRPYVQSL